MENYVHHIKMNIVFQDGIQKLVVEHKLLQQLMLKLLKNKLYMLNGKLVLNQ